MFSSFKEARDFVRAQHIELIDLLYCDLWGNLHHVTLTSREFTQEAMTEGVGFDGSSVGFKHVNAGDMVLIPDLGTAFVDPFHSQPTLACLCSVYEADTKELYLFDPREIARRAEQKLISSGIADKSLWGPEFEFYIFDRITLKNSPAYTLCQIDSGEANWGTFINPNGYSFRIIRPIKPHHPAITTTKSGTKSSSPSKNSVSPSNTIITKLAVPDNPKLKRLCWA